MLRVLKLNKLATLLAGMAIAMLATAALGAVEDEIRERLQPAGTVCVMGTECAASLNTSSAGGSGEPRAAMDIYQTYCFACHGTGANNAPVYGEVAQWEDRLAKGRDALYDSLVNGFNNGAMPAKGLCMDCSDDELNAVLDYMLEPVQ